MEQTIIDLLLKTDNLLERELLFIQLEIECNIDYKIRTEDIANDMGENYWKDTRIKILLKHGMKLIKWRFKN